jgi:hypothetical protein
MTGQPPADRDACFFPPELFLLKGISGHFDVFLFEPNHIGGLRGNQFDRIVSGQKMLQRANGIN